jgi:sugar O-acyltransferase (sialic acid O-acetyltransferase NeuD family)
MIEIIVVGGGGHAKVVTSILHKLDYEILGYVDPVDKGKILGIPYLGNDEELFRAKKKVKMALGIGEITNDDFRKLMVLKFLEHGFSFESIVSPNAVVNKDVYIGEGAVVMDGAIIQPGTSIGSYCIVNTRVSIDHDCVIGDYVHLAPAVTLCGNVSIGSDCMIGSGATIVNDVTISEKQFVKAGSIISQPR